jgi:hypothetical protein
MVYGEFEDNYSCWFGKVLSASSPFEVLERETSNYLAWRDVQRPDACAVLRFVYACLFLYILTEYG